MSSTRRMERDLPRWGWQERAACRDADIGLFFGREGERQSERERRERAAKRICARCPVREACLEQAVRVPENYGGWGGYTEAERASERRRRRRQASQAA